MFKLKRRYLDILGENTREEYIFIKEHLAGCYKYGVKPDRSFIIRYSCLRRAYRDKLLSEGIITGYKIGRRIIYKYNT